MRTFGIFRREETKLQNSATALLQEKSQEVWGRAAWGSDLLTVKAYRGPLQAGERGIEFSTDIKPNKTSSPIHARWYYGHDEGVERRTLHDEDFACISAEVCNHQK